jgi:hypothetical protein
VANNDYGTDRSVGAVLSSRLRRSESFGKIANLDRFLGDHFLSPFFHHFGERATVGLQALPDLLGKGTAQTASAVWAVVSSSEA